MTGNDFAKDRESLAYQLKARGFTVINRDARRIEGGHKRKWTIARHDGRMDSFEEHRVLKTVCRWFPNAVVQSRSITWVVVSWKEVK